MSNLEFKSIEVFQDVMYCNISSRMMELQPKSSVLCSFEYIYITNHLITFSHRSVIMKFNYSYEVEGGNEIQLELRLRLWSTFKSILAVALATLPRERRRRSGFERRNSATKMRVWQGSHHAEGNGVEKKQRGKTKLASEEDGKKRQMER